MLRARAFSKIANLSHRQSSSSHLALSRWNGCWCNWNNWLQPRSQWGQSMPFKTPWEKLPAQDKNLVHERFQAAELMRAWLIASFYKTPEGLGHNDLGPEQHRGSRGLGIVVPPAWRESLSLMPRPFIKWIAYDMTSHDFTRHFSHCKCFPGNPSCETQPCKP